MESSAGSTPDGKKPDDDQATAPGHPSDGVLVPSEISFSSGENDSGDELYSASAAGVSYAEQLIGIIVDYSRYWTSTPSYRRRLGVSDAHTDDDMTIFWSEWSIHGPLRGPRHQSTKFARNHRTISTKVQKIPNVYIIIPVTTHRCRD